MASKIFVLIATLTVATCSPLYESQTYPNLLPRAFPRLPFNFPGRGIFGPGTTVCETSNPQLLTPSTTVCESNSIPNLYSLPNIPTATVCESSQSPFSMLPMNPPTTTVCETSPSIPPKYSGGCGCPNMGGLGMSNIPTNGLSMQNLGMPNMMMNGLYGQPNLGLGCLSAGVPMPIIATLLSCLGVL